MTPHLTVHRRHPSGELVAQKIAIPKRESYGFHRNLADHLLLGEPLRAPLEDSMKVVAILEAAKISSNNGCTPRQSVTYLINWGIWAMVTLPAHVLFLPSKVHTMEKSGLSGPEHPVRRRTSPTNITFSTSIRATKLSLKILQ